MTAAAPVVVGVDRTESVIEAVCWAAREAERGGRPVRLVHAEPDPVEPPSRLRDEWQRLREAGEVARTVAPQIVLDLHVEVSDPASTLLRESEAAHVIVLGGLSGVLMGPTATTLVAHARCPVVSVRGHANPGGPVVVGVDGSAEREHVVDWAFDEAAALGTGLIAVHVWHPEISGLALSAVDRHELASEHHRMLDQRLAYGRRRHPEVEGERVVTNGHVTRSLLAHSESAQLVVVGSRGRGHLTGMLLGSTSQALLYHAHCPVLVVGDEVDATVEEGRGA